METTQNRTHERAGRANHDGPATRELVETAGDGLHESMHREPLQSTWNAMERIPVGVYYAAVLGSIATAFGLFVTGKKDSAQFVGQWAPTFALLGLMNKLLQPGKN